MLKRIITFFVVAGIVSMFFFYDHITSDIIGFFALMVLVTILATNEFFTITSRGKGNQYEIIGYLIVLGMTLSSYMAEFKFFWNSNIMLVAVSFLFLVSLYELKTKKLISADNPVAFVIRSILYIGCFYPFIILIRGLDHGFAYIVYLIFTVATCDTAAYFIGIKFGKHKIAPAISPKKSVEGSIAGFFGAIIASYLLGAHYLGATNAILMGSIVGIFGQMGDFYESLLKRECEVKDSGWILPGHGGVMDRLDNAIFIVPFLYFYITKVIL